MGHLSDTLIAVCSTLSSVPPADDELNEKFLLIFVIQCSAGRSLFRNKLCKTELTEGLWTNWRTNRWEQQQAVTVICIVFLPGLQTFFK